MDERSFQSRAAELAAQYRDCEWLDLSPGSGLLLRDWLPTGESRALLAHCLASLPWERPSLRLFGKEHPIPRRHTFVGDTGAVYRWSGLEQQPQPWTPPLAAVRTRLAAAGFPFNSLLANHYRDGGDSMGWHADNERELGPSPVVATVSLGQQRRLAFRRRDGTGRLAVDLPEGSLLLTSGAVQGCWLHGIAKSARRLGPRVSLTLRDIKL